MALELQCVDCGGVFSTDEEVTEHLEPGECCEWENHRMAEVTFRVYTQEMHDSDQAVAESWRRYYSDAHSRALAMNKVIDSGHLGMAPPELITHLINDHEFGEGARTQWNLDTQRDMHRYAHEQAIEDAWWRADEVNR